MMTAPFRSVGHVYVAADTDGWHKIGITDDPTTREYHLSRDRGREVRMVFLSLRRIKPEFVEAAAHWLLSQADSKHEWFDVDQRTAIGAVNSATVQVDAGHIPHARYSHDRRKSFRADLDARARLALLPGETLCRLLDLALERELDRREKPKD